MNNFSRFYKNNPTAVRAEIETLQHCSNCDYNYYNIAILSELQLLQCIIIITITWLQYCYSYIYIILQITLLCTLLKHRCKSNFVELIVRLHYCQFATSIRNCSAVYANDESITTYQLRESFTANRYSYRTASLHSYMHSQRSNFSKHIPASFSSIGK